MLKIGFWPTIAKEWLTRDRLWPPKEMVKELTKCCYLSGLADTKEKSYEFAYSFYNVEKELTKCMSSEQIESYFTFKTIFNTFVAPIDPEHTPDYLCKTIMLRIMEIHPPHDSFWRDNIEVLKRLFTLTLKAVEKEELADYFIPSMNIMELVRDAYPHKKMEICRRLKEIINNIKRYLDELKVEDALKYYSDIAAFCEDINITMKEMPGKTKSFSFCGNLRF